MVDIPNSAVLMFTVSLYSTMGAQNRLKLEAETTAQAFTSSGAWNKLPPVWSRGRVHPLHLARISSRISVYRIER